MVKKNVIVNLLALCLLIGGFVAFILKSTTTAVVMILAGVLIYMYQKMTKSSI